MSKRKKGKVTSGILIGEVDVENIFFCYFSCQNSDRNSLTPIKIIKMGHF